MKVILWVYSFVFFFDMLFLLRAIKNAKAYVNEMIEKTREEMDRLELPVIEKREDGQYIGVDWFRFWPFVMMSITPIVNVLYMYVFIRRGELVENALASAFVRKFLNAFDEATMGEEN